jgi:hypothetical protein
MMMREYWWEIGEYVTYAFLSVGCIRIPFFLWDWMRETAGYFYPYIENLFNDFTLAQKGDMVVPHFWGVP